MAASRMVLWATILLGALAILSGGMADAQWSSVPYDKYGNQYKPSHLDTRGMFGARTFGETLRPETRNKMFPNSGIVRGPSGNFMGRNQARPASMFRPNLTTDSELAAASRPAQIAEIVPQAQPLAETEPWPVPGIEPTTVPMDGDLGDTTVIPRPAPGQPPIEPPESVWIRSPEANGASAQMPGVAPGAAEGMPQGMVPMAGPAAGDGQPAAMDVPPEAIWMRAQPSAGPTLSAAENQRVALRLANLVVRSPSVRPVSPITVTYANGQATVSGMVADAHGRTMAAQLLLADPMVVKVRNLLQMQNGRAQPMLPGGGAALPIARPDSYDEELPVPLGAVAPPEEQP